MSKIKESQLVMQEHSIAKIELYRRYLSIYLNVISRVNFINKVYLYDLFAGEGKYLNNESGSPLITMETIKDHYFSNNKTCPNLEITFNDFGKSEIEPDIDKIERVKGFIQKIYKPESVKLNYTNLDYNKSFDDALNKLKDIKTSERALLFIDPWGYKEIKPEEIKQILANGKTELILFLPISHMHRFAGKALSDESFHGGRPLREFLKELFKNEIPQIDSQALLINAIRERFQVYTGVKYVDTFTIEREKNSTFCLFFFTSNKTGYYKMLNAKWDMDENNGKGFRILDKHQSSLFNAVDCVDYKYLIGKFLKEGSNGRTNQELFDFGLIKGFLPKHTNSVLKQMKDTIIVTALDGKTVKGYYIDDEHDRKILIKFK